MRVFHRYIIILALSSLLINFILALAGQTDLSAYFALNVLVYLLITVLYVHVNPRARTALNTIGFVLFGGFAVTAVFKVLEVMTRQ